MNKIKISKKSPRGILSNKKNGVYNFINANTIWWLKNSEFYYCLMSKNENINFIDGRVLSFFVGIKQNRGPTFTKEFLASSVSKNKKHFFIGNVDIKLLSSKITISEKKLLSYNPPYIGGLEFSIEEMGKIIALLRKFKPNFIWVCVGSPKQEILANQLFVKFPGTYFSIGAATDFLLGKKKESPIFFQKMGLEWFYRLITDFKYSKKKVWRSFIGLGYLLNRKVWLKNE